MTYLEQVNWNLVLHEILVHVRYRLLRVFLQKIDGVLVCIAIIHRASSNGVFDIVRICNKAPSLPIAGMIDDRKLNSFYRA